MARKPQQEEAGEKAPLWIISFADMITLLMSFFVMLQTLAKDQDATLLGASRDSFKRAISGFGIPDLLFGEQTGNKEDYLKLKYPTEEADEEPNKPSRIIDADDEKIRQLFLQIRKDMETRTSNASEKLVNMTPTPIRFESGGEELTAADKEFLRNLAGGMAGELNPQVHRICVSMSAEEGTPRSAQWMSAARRARGVAEQLRKYLQQARPGKWQVSSQGGGGSPRRSQPAGQGGSRPCIMIAVTQVR
ncbi:MAG: flagellar motor protein MotB [Phycisphaerae bacterium]|jgi:flagellar motor protein MotB